MRLWISGGEPNLRRAVEAAADAFGLELLPLDPSSPSSPPESDDALIDLGLPPAEYGRDLAGRESARVREVARSVPSGVRWVRTSVLRASPEAGSALQRAMSAAEAAAREASTNLVVLRAGVVLGDCGIAAVYRRFVERSKFVVAPGFADAKFEPIGAPDFAAYCVDAARRKGPFDDVYDLSCGEMLTGRIFVRDLAENLGHSRWRIALPWAVGTAIVSSFSTPDFPAAAVRYWIECLAGGLLPRRLNVWEHFDLRPASLREAMAQSAGMIVPVRARDEEGGFTNWRKPKKKGILWTRGR